MPPETHHGNTDDAGSAWPRLRGVDGDLCGCVCSAAARDRERRVALSWRRCRAHPLVLTATTSPTSRWRGSGGAITSDPTATTSVGPPRSTSPAFSTPAADVVVERVVVVVWERRYVEAAGTVVTQDLQCPAGLGARCLERSAQCGGSGPLDHADVRRFARSPEVTWTASRLWDFPVPNPPNDSGAVETAACS